MNTLSTASYEFMKRPSDERFTSLWELGAFAQSQRDRSMSKVVSSRKMEFASTPDDKGIVMKGNHRNASPSHWAFGQMATLSGVPARLLRAQAAAGLAPLAAKNLNAGFQVIRDVEDVGLLVREQERVNFGEGMNSNINLAALTGPNYGRVWNSQLTDQLIKEFGNGVNDTDWTVPGFFGKPLSEITKENTTLYASDRDMFAFLADEKNRIEVPNRRNGEPGSLARGFFTWNSEVGSKTIGLGFFMFDYVCMNRMIWGVQEFQKIALRHTSSAPDRWIEEIVPVLEAYSKASARPIEAKLQAAQQTKINNAEQFLAKHFSNSQVASVMATQLAEEDRPIETLWDAATAVTAFARTIPYADERVEMEQIGGSFLDLAKVEISNTQLKELF